MAYELWYFIGGLEESVDFDTTEPAGGAVRLTAINYRDPETAADDAADREWVAYLDHGPGQAVVLDRAGNVVRLGAPLGLTERYTVAG